MSTGTAMRLSAMPNAYPPARRAPPRRAAGPASEVSRTSVSKASRVRLPRDAPPRHERQLAPQRRVRALPVGSAVVGDEQVPLAARAEGRAVRPLRDLIGAAVAA